MPRQESKFLLTPTQVDALRSMILPHVEADPHAARRPGREYTVRSVYLDCCRLGFYHEKQSGLRDRLKVRIRGYNEITPTTPVYLEIKKKADGEVVKRRSSLLYGDLRAFVESQDVEKYIRDKEGRDVALANAMAFLYCMQRRALGPVIAVAYEREAFFSRHDVALRITLDKNLRSYPPAALLSAPHDAAHRCALGQGVILEIKSEFGLPQWLRVVLSRIGTHRSALSKYTISIDCLAANGHQCEQAPWSSVAEYAASPSTWVT